MMSASTLKPTRAEQKRQQKLLHNEYISQPGPRGKQISSFEKLPVEVIQHIFFFCLETNLANASLILGKALSDESIYRVVILFAYFDYIRPYPVETALFRPARGYGYDISMPFDENKRILYKELRGADPVLGGTDDSAAMELLIRDSLGSIPHDDSVLTAWALRMKAKGNALGNWLLDYMTHVDSSQGVVFYNGAWGSDTLRTDVFPYSSFTRDIGYLTTKYAVDKKPEVVTAADTTTHV
ncbi:hypothetical protein DV737_g3461, partial [Chaetothyriales sp. CBS 132003]